jgi:hypothetical protein
MLVLMLIEELADGGVLTRDQALGGGLTLRQGAAPGPHGSVDHAASRGLSGRPPGSSSTGSTSPSGPAGWPSKSMVGHGISDVDRFAQDRVRQNALVLAGWTVLRFTWHDLMSRPQAVVAEIRAALRITATARR